MPCVRIVRRRPEGVQAWPTQNVDHAQCLANPVSYLPALRFLLSGLPTPLGSPIG